MGGVIAESQGGDFGSGFARGAASAATAFLCNDTLEDLKYIKDWIKNKAWPYIHSKFTAVYFDLEAHYYVGAGIAGYSYMENDEVMYEVYVKGCVGYSKGGGVGVGAVFNSKSNPQNALKGLAVEIGKGIGEFSFSVNKNPVVTGGVVVGAGFKASVCYYFQLDKGKLTDLIK